MRLTAFPPSDAARVAGVLTSWPFAACLALLVANDRWLKWAYPGVVTGKLSDFAGLGVAGLLLAGAFPRHRTALALSLALAFAWWKSPLSQPFIDLVSGITGFSVGRTVDLSDVAAVAILPVCGPLADRARRFPAWQAVRDMLAVPAAAATALAIMGTTLVETKRDFSVRPAESGAGLEAARLADVIDRVATQNGLRPLSKSADGALYSGNGMRLSYRLDANSRAIFQASATASGPFFGTPGATRVDRLRDDLKQSLAREFPRLEYAEPLEPPPAPHPPCNFSPVPSCR